MSISHNETIFYGTKSRGIYFCKQNQRFRLFTDPIVLADCDGIYLLFNLPKNIYIYATYDWQNILF